MVLVTETEIASTSQKAVEALYGQNIQDFNVRVFFHIRLILFLTEVIQLFHVLIHGMFK